MKPTSTTDVFLVRMMVLVGTVVLVLGLTQC